MKVVARVKLEKEDISLIHEIISRDLISRAGTLNRENFVEMSKMSQGLVRLMETLLNDAFSRGMEFRDRNMATHIEVE